MGGIDVSVVIDSGASVNVIDRVLWEKLKAKNIKCKSWKTNKPIYSYGSQESLTVAGCFTVEVCVPTSGRNITNDVYVIEEPGCAILCRKTATLLGLLNLSVPSQPQVNPLQSDTNNLSEQFKDVFTGVGKLKDYQLKMTVDPSVQPVIQSTRRVPYRLREKLADKLRELEELDIIEKVDTPSDWVSPVVVVPKANGDIRLCVDMRRANEAVVRERYQVPVLD